MPKGGIFTKKKGIIKIPNNKFKSFFENHLFIIFMSQATRRNLRNSNTCPSIDNPFTEAVRDQKLIEFIPAQIVEMLKILPALTCSQIQSLPELSPDGSLRAAAERMRKATEWQARGVEAASKRDRLDEKIEENASIIQLMPDQEFETKKCVDDPLVCSLNFQHELHSFINHPQYDL